MKDERVIKRIEVDKEVYEVGVDGVLWIAPYETTKPDGEKEHFYKITHKDSGTMYRAEAVTSIKYENRVKPIRKDLLKLFSFSLLVSLIIGLFKGFITLKTIGILLLGGVAILVALLVLVIGVSFLIR